MSHERGPELSFRVDYRPDLFDESYARGIGDRMLRVLGVLAEDSSLLVGRLDTLGAVDRERVLVEWNGTGTELPDTPLHELVQEQARQNPDAVAVVGEGGGESLTYRQLNSRANQLARHFIGQNIGSEQFVALALPRTPDTIVTMLAVLKTGAAYLPIDPDYPADRITYMLSDAAPALTLTETLPHDTYSHHQAGDLTDQTACAPTPRGTPPT